ncbi:septum formation initiator family protein [Bacteroidia bacterium]|nr:septum formation initiator family protein [Bacteroidia bacterium]
MNLLELLEKYRYYLFTSFLVIWMLFIDSNNVFFRVKLNKQVNELKKSIVKHKAKIQDLQYTQKSILGNQPALEVFARETYFMKKEDEDLFVIVPKKKQIK